jgi:protein-tyrosine phosphatase
MDNKEIYSIKINKGKRTYFFDVKKSEQGHLYLKISESKKTDNGFDHYNLVIFEEDLKDFSDAFQNALSKINDYKKPVATSIKTYSVEKIRETHNQAYLPWTEEDDNKLKELFYKGQKTKELSQIFGRNEGAISSRIKKLGLSR